MSIISIQISHVFFIIVIGYLLGCINGSQIIGKYKGVDIKNSGVKNPGASNTTIVLGWKYGIIVAIIDILKAVLPIIFVGMILSAQGIQPETIRVMQYIVGTMVILGHNYPVQMNFSGGKGTASAVGMFLAINWKFGLLSILFLVLIGLISNYLVIGVFGMYSSFIATTYLFEAGAIATLITMSLLLLSIFQHRENISRIRNKTETKVLSVVGRKK